MPEFDAEKLKWHAPENLRWLAHNIPGGYMPCGMLRSHFLNTVAEMLESRVKPDTALTDQS